MSRPSPRTFRLCSSILGAILASLCCLACAEISDANDSLYDKVFERSRQRRIEKDMANLKAGRPLQYYHSSADLYKAKRTGRD